MILELFLSFFAKVIMKFFIINSGTNLNKNYENYLEKIRYENYL